MERKKKKGKAAKVELSASPVTQGREEQHPEGAAQRAASEEGEKKEGKARLRRSPQYYVV